jgi:hypothetical protein
MPSQVSHKLACIDSSVVVVCTAHRNTGLPVLRQVLESAEPSILLVIFIPSVSI